MASNRLMRFLKKRSAAETDSSIFVDPITPLGSETESRDISKRRWILDEDYQGFSLAPKHLLEPYKTDKAEHPKQCGPFEKGNTSMVWPEGRDRTISAQLFCAMTNFVS